MAENLTVARPYAKAAFDLALSANSTDTWQNMLCAMACACKDEVFLQALKNSASPESAVALMKQLLDDGRIDGAFRRDTALSCRQVGAADPPLLHLGGKDSGGKGVFG